MNMAKRLAFVWIVAAAAAAACGDARKEARPPAVPGLKRIALAVDGRSNDAPSAAALGRTVIVVWTARQDQAADVYSSVSIDGGATFAAPVRVNDVEGDARASGEQPARVVIGREHGQGRSIDVFHVVWPTRRDGRAELRYASSSDGGRSFTKASTIAGEREPGIRGWQSIAIGHDGAVHVLWLDGRHAEPRPAGAPHRHSGAKPAGSAPRATPRQDVFHASWKGSGPRFENAVADNVCFCCKTAIVTAGERIFAAFRHIYPGSLRDIAVARSIDNGVTFGTPIRLSEDGWKIEACPDDGPAMAADTHGGVHVAWPAMVAGDTPRKGMFYASLPEGAAADQPFTARLRLDAGDGHAAHPQIASDDHGNTAVVWDEHLGDRRRIVLRRVSSGKASDPEHFEGGGVSYPVVAAAEAHWVLVWSAQGPDGRSLLEVTQVPRAE
jgi:hypothetical protein